MPRARDSAGNIWEVDAAGNPVRMLQPAQQSFPGSIPGAFVPPNPAKLAEKQREQQRQDAADARAADAARRSAAEWNASHNPDGSPKVQAPSLLGDPTKTGPQYLTSLPQNIRNRVQQLLDGRSMLTAREKGTPLGQQLMDAANQADPTFDENVSHARYVERTQYTGQGKGSQLVQAANRFARHLGDLYEASRELGGPDLGWAPLSNVATATTNSFRQKKVATYKTILPLIQGEVQKLTKNGAATEGEAQHIMNSLSVDQPEDVRYAAMKELARLGRAQIEPLHQSWESAWQGSTPPPIPMDVDPVANAIFDAVDAGTAPPARDKRGEFVVPGVNDDGTPNEMGGGSGAPPVGPSGPKLSSGVPRADYSGMVGGPQQAVATEGMRRVPDTVGAAALAAFIRKGTPYETAAAYAQSHGFMPPDPQAYAQGVAFAKQHGGAVNVEADRFAPVTMGERISASGPAAGFAGAVSGASAGLSDVAGRTIAGPGWDANRAAMAALSPGWDVGGNVLGGIGGAFALPSIAGRLAPGLAAKAAAFAERNPVAARIASNGAYGATYGASENPDDPLGGAVMGGLTGIIGGEVGNRATKGLANVIAPPAGRFGPAYEAGVFPTMGQRFGRSGMFGRALNTTEQAMQSFPLLGAGVVRARDLARDAAQVGGFNQALGELAPFDSIVGSKISGLPDGMGPGTEPHLFTKGAFDKAYDIARQGMQFVPDGQYVADHQAFATTLNNGVLSAPQVGQVQQVINSSVGSRLPNGGGAMTGEAYQKAGSEIDKAINAWSKDGTTQPMAEALSNYKTIFDSAARRNSDPAAVNLLDAADRGYAKYAILRNAGARVGGDPGTFTMKNLARAVQQEGGGVKSGPYQRGQALMQDYSEAVQPLGDSLANSGTGERLLTNKMFLGEQGAAGLGLGHSLFGALAAHPGALAPFLPYAPGMNKLVTRAIAPRQYTLPPVLAEPLNLAGEKINLLAPYVGKAAVPGSLAYMGYGQ